MRVLCVQVWIGLCVITLMHEHAHNVFQCVHAYALTHGSLHMRVLACQGCLALLSSLFEKFTRR